MTNRMLTAQLLIAHAADRAKFVHLLAPETRELRLRNS
jgi:hypothetical protein